MGNYTSCEPSTTWKVGGEENEVTVIPIFAGEELAPVTVTFTIHEGSSPAPPVPAPVPVPVPAPIPMPVFASIPPAPIPAPVQAPIPSPVPPETSSDLLLSLVLVDSDSNNDLMDLGDGTGHDPLVVDFSALASSGADIGKLNIKAEVKLNKSVDKVKFLLPTKRTENHAPYTLCGDIRGNYMSCEPNLWKVGEIVNEVTAIPIVSNDEKDPVTVFFTIVGVAPSSRSFTNRLHDTVTGFMDHFGWS
jgi:hypothetical protein